MGFPGFAAGQQLGEENLARRRMLEEEARQAQIANLQNAGLSPAEVERGIADIEARDPSVFRQHAENLLGRFVGRKPKSVVDYKAQRKADLNQLLAKGTTPEQRQLGSVEKALEWVQSLPPDQQRMALQFLGVKAAPKWVNIRNPKTGETAAIDETEGIPPGWVLAGSSAGYVRQSSHVVTPQDAISLMKSGAQTFPKQNGQMWTPEELAQFPPGTVLAGFVQGDQMFYAPFDQRTRTTTIGNEVYQIPEAGQINAESAQPLGMARVPTVGTRQVPGMNPGETITLRSTTTPQTTGAAGFPTGAPAALPASPSSVSSSTQTPRAGGASARSIHPAPKKAVNPSPQSGISSPPPPFAKGTMLSQGRNAEPVVAAMNTVAAQVFGQNGEEPIWKNAWMFDNPQIRTALNRALTLNALAIPGTEDDPSFTQTLATALGVTGWSQEQIQRANVEARQQLQKLGEQLGGPLVGHKVMEMFARMAGLQEDLSALRSATKGSAAQGSIRTLVRAAPVYNVSSSQNFRDQLGVTLNTAAAAMSGYPAINPAYLEWFRKGAQMARGESQGTAQDKGQQPQLSLGQPIGKTSKPDGTYFKNGKVYIAKGGLVYAAPAAQ